MIRLVVQISLLAVVFAATAAKIEKSFGDGDADLGLTFVARFKIENEAVGLHAPSGLALSHGNNALWTVSGGANRVFKLNLDGDLQIEQPTQIPDRAREGKSLDLEGISLDPTGKFLFVVHERENEIIKLNATTQQVVDRKLVSEMAGFDTVARYFVNSPKNKGLEAQLPSGIEPELIGSTGISKPAPSMLPL